MSLTKETVVKIASLSRIRVPEPEQEKLAEQLSRILEFVEQLEKVDTDTTEPMTSVVHSSPKLRDDVVKDGGQAAAVLLNAPSSTAGFFTVPKVIE